MSWWKRIFSARTRCSYSQSGEDAVLDYFFSNLQIEKPSYLDIGAHHPSYLSNTYRFYLKGSQGACVEPDPDLCREIRRLRPRDLCLNVGIGDGKRKRATLYRMSTATLNTFSRAEAKAYTQSGNYGPQSVIGELQVELLTLNQVIERHLSACPEFVSVDIEGLDESVLRSFDFRRWRPKAFCVETVRYRKNGALAKVDGIFRLFKRHGYFAYADTFLNSIFARKDLMKVAGQRFG